MYMIKILLISAGLLSLALGIAGIFLPLLPTTPFLLLSAACFMRSSTRLYRWLTGHKIFGGYIRGYQQFRAVSPRTKIISLALLWLTIGGSLLFAPYLWLKVTLALIAVGVTIHIVRLKTLTPAMRAKLDSSQP